MRDSLIAVHTFNHPANFGDLLPKLFCITALKFVLPFAFFSNHREGLTRPLLNSDHNQSSKRIKRKIINTHTRTFLLPESVKVAPTLAR